MRAAVYTRVSTAEQSTCEQQEALCREYAERQGWQVVAAFSDTQSGLDADRPGWQALLLAASRREFDAVIVYRLDRFGRDPADAFPAVKALAGQDVKLISASEGDDPLLQGLMFVLAQHESRTTSTRVATFMRGLAAQGRWVSRAPLGYDVVRTPGQPGGALVPNDDAQRVRRLFELYADGDHSIGDLQKEAAGLSRQRIHMILRNPAYVGTVAYGRLSNGKFSGRRKHSEWIEVAGQHPAIVDAATWQAVQRRLKFNRDHRTAKQTDYLLTSFIRCGLCGGRMQGQRFRRKSGTYYHLYRCWAGVEFRACAQRYVSGPVVDQAVRDALAGLLPRVGNHARDTAKALVLREAQRQLAAERKEAGRLRAQRDKQVREMTKLTEGFIADRILPEVFDRMVADAKESIGRIDAELKVLARDDPAGGYRQSVEALWSMMERVPWPPAPDNFLAWRKVVELSVDFVEVFNREDVRVHLNAAARVSSSGKAGHARYIRPRGSHA